jgi:hypothetical protein
MNRERNWLKNRNRAADLSKAVRCGARNRRGTSCACPAMQNGRCRLHGGLSTGPKTAAGIERIRRAVTKHGCYSKQAQKERKDCRVFVRDFRQDLEAIAKALYSARSSVTFERLMKPLTEDEREQVSRRVAERIDADKARFSQLTKAPSVGTLEMALPGTDGAYSKTAK